MGPCAKCGRAVPDGKPACMYCGTRVEALVSCAGCGRQLLASAPKCNYCGRAKSSSVRAPSIEEVAKARGEVFLAAERARGARQFEAALSFYEEVVHIDPANARAWLGMGRTLAALQRNPQAVAAIDRALAIQPDLADAATLRKSLVPSRMPSSAVLRAVTADTGVAATLALATVEMERGNHAAALSMLDDAVRSLPEQAAHASLAGLYCSRGICLKMVGRPAEALAMFEQALRCEPRHAKAWSEKGVVLADSHHLDDALAAFDTAISYDANDAKSWADRGHVLRALGKIEDAVASYDRALALEPGLANARAAREEIRLGTR